LLRQHSLVSPMERWRSQLVINALTEKQQLNVTTGLVPVLIFVMRIDDKSGVEFTPFVVPRVGIFRSSASVILTLPKLASRCVV